jgi:diaminopimelate decarboxylase/aspartate kinase
VASQKQLLSLAASDEDAVMEEKNGAGWFVYSLPEVKRNIEAIKGGLTALSSVFYAVKANTHIDVVRTVLEADFNVECVSIGELRFIQKHFPDLNPVRVLFTPSFADIAEYKFALEAGFNVTADNDWLWQTFPEVFRDKEIFLRCDIGYAGVGHHAHVRTGSNSKFGLPVDDLPSVMDGLNAIDCRVVGLHVHRGSGIGDYDTWGKNVTFLAALLKHFPHVRVFNLGGGLPVPYRLDEAPFDLARMNQVLQDALAHSTKEIDARAKDIRLWMEPGRFIAATAGVLLARVTQLKKKPLKSFVGINSGMNAMIRPPLYTAYHHIVNLTRWSPADAEDSKQEQDSQTLVCDVVGYCCETACYMGKDISLSAATQHNDILLVENSGAYGAVMGSSYNMRPQGTEVIFS